MRQSVSLHGGAAVPRMGRAVDPQALRSEPKEFPSIGRAWK